MKKIFAINGSPRPNGNSSFLLEAFLDGAKQNNAILNSVSSHKLNISDCTGCLRCNLIKRCSIRNDDWGIISQQILDSDVLVFASPVYFHHFPASLKAVVDRYRSFIKVSITEKSIDHQPWAEWDKDFVLLLSMGSSDDIDAKPIVDLFEYMIKILGPKNKLHIITATRLGVNKQVSFSKEELAQLYSKINLPVKLAAQDSISNKNILQKCFDLGKGLSQSITCTQN